MPRSKKNTESPLEEFDLQSPDDKPRARGVYIPLTADGQVDEARIKHPEKFEEARRALGMMPGEFVSAQPYLKPSSIDVDPNFVRGIYRAVEVSLQWIGSSFLKWPHDLAAQMRYTEEQKDRLVPPTKAVIEKLAPAWLVKHQEIATLAVIFAAETQSMVENALRGYVALHPELVKPSEPAPAKPNGRSITEEHISGDALAAA
jgi:hypothetical protein